MRCRGSASWPGAAAAEMPMIEIDVPDFRTLRLQHLVLDYNGTLAVDGQLLAGMADMLTRLAQRLQIHVVTADTFGMAAAQLAGLPVQVLVLSPVSQADAKLAFVTGLGPEHVVAIREQLLEKVGGGLQAILALYRSGSEFRRLLDELPAGAYTCAPDGLITYFNQHAVRLWGRAPKLNDPSDRFCGSFKLFASDGSPIKHDQCWMALALQLRKEYNGHEIVIERPDGERLTALAHANPIIDEDGKLLGAVNVLVDISDRKRMEDALNQADRAKNEFLATLAHELRNPLAPIRNAVHILQLQGSRTKDARSAVEVIDRQLQYMTRLGDELIGISPITRHKINV